ncbi:hypothetical protein R5R73_07420 [Salinicola sp. LHM]|uniref:hypothetical protein n=1 Tax=Salinicola sp. LHM TaxID=3065298 RepID=UPI002ACE50B8|nr:hypothetical protein [Salinicola sp. LHM]WQH34508.1 hypothetical protein R5R73_07420 [Salinicola sp. LHM]
MSDIEALQTEIDALKAKNAELLDELKRAKKSRESEGLKEQVEKLEAEKGELADQIHQLTFEKPVNEFFKSVCPAASALRQTFSEHFDIARGEDGKFYINDKDGNPTLKAVKVGQHGEEHHPRELTFDNLHDLIHERGLEDIRYFMPKPTGSGATGSTYRSAPRPPDNDNKPQEKTLNRPQLGMR